MTPYISYTVDTIADLVHPQGTGRNEATVLGYNTPGDGGGGTFYWKTGTFTGNSGTIFPKAAVGSNPAGAWFRLIEASISVKWFGAVGDGTTNDFNAITNAITYIAGIRSTFITANSTYLIGGNEIGARNFSEVAHVLYFPTARYKVVGTLYLPSGVIIDGQHSTLLGGGSSSNYWKTGGTLFESGYIDNNGNPTTNPDKNTGFLTSNIGTSVESRRVEYSEVKNLVVQYYGLGFNLFNCNEATRFENLIFTDCYQAMIMNRCFFSYVNNCYSRTTVADPASYKSGFDQAAFVFSGVSNIITINDISVNSRHIGFKFSDAINGMIITNLDAEAVDIGISFFQEKKIKQDGNLQTDVEARLSAAANPLTLTSCYFENISTTAIRFELFTTNNLEFSGNWFYSCPTCFTFVNTDINNTRIAANNTFFASPSIVSLDDYSRNRANNFIVEPSILTPVITIDETTSPSFQNGTLPAQFAGLPPNINLTGYKTVYTNDTGQNVEYRGQFAPYNYVVPKYYTGRSGYVVNRIPYTRTEFAVGVYDPNSYLFDIIIHTDIFFDDGTSVVFNFTIGDFNYVYNFRGKVLGKDLLLEGIPPKTIQFGPDTDKLSFRIFGLYHPSHQFSKSGTIQIL